MQKKKKKKKKRINWLIYLFLRSILKVYFQLKEKYWKNVYDN